MFGCGGSLGGVCAWVCVYVDVSMHMWVVQASVCKRMEGVYVCVCSWTVMCEGCVGMCG